MMDARVRLGRSVGVALGMLLLAGHGGRAAQLLRPLPDTPSALCTRAIGGTERAAQLAPHLLGVIALVESGRRDPAGKGVGPWPWTINVNGTGFFFDSKEQAVAAVQALQTQGVQSIDVGCMQVNLFHHPRAFPSLDAAFDPQSNVAYAARFLRGLYVQTGTWPRAAAAYHSQTPELGADYLRRVMALWPDGQQYDASDLLGLQAPSAPAGPPRDYTPELASRLATDRAGLQQVLEQMRLPPPTDMRRRRAELTRTTMRSPARLFPGRSSSGHDGALASAEADLPVLNATALAAFRPSGPTVDLTRRIRTDRMINGRTLAVPR